MRFNLEKVRTNVREAETADLLDRATVWRYGMEAEALEVIEAELHKRGIGPAEVEAHAQRRAGEVVAGPNALAAVCYRCTRPAVERRWVWGRLWRVLPLFPRRAYVCEEHRSHGRTAGGETATGPEPSRHPLS